MSLTRRKPLRAKPRSKGSRAELQVIEMLRAHGWTGAHRNFQSGGQGGGDVINGPPGCSIEVKHCEATRLWEWLAQCQAAAQPTDIPLLFFRRNRSGWYVALPAQDVLDLLKLREAL